MSNDIHAEQAMTNENNRRGKRKGAGEMNVSPIERESIERGIALNQIQIAQKMFPAGESDDKIHSYARITPEQLEEIREENSSTIHRYA